MTSAKILKHSISENGVELITFELTFPRIILAEFNTHRLFSRNSSSSRAVPTNRMLKAIEENPFIPTTFPSKHKGMSTDSVEPYAVNKNIWLEARDNAVSSAKNLIDSGVSKQIANRLLEPFMYQTVIMTTTNLSNFFAQRISPHAEQHINELAILMKDVVDKSEPTPTLGGWHLPLLTEDETSLRISDLVDLCYVSSARCARVSYLSTVKRTYDEDLDLGRKLEKLGHFSPFEHIAFDNYFGVLKFSGGNLANPWVQFRKTLANEMR